MKKISILIFLILISVSEITLTSSLTSFEDWKKRISNLQQRYEVSSHSLPSNSKKYKSILIRVSRYHFGINAPIGLFAGQIHQESAWRPRAESIYAKGLTQFTPETAKWITKLYPQLEEVRPFDPVWSIKAMLLYDKRLYNSVDPIKKESIDDCNKWAIVLMQYNGGPGWWNRDRKLAMKNGDHPDIWWSNVENHSNRGERFFEENRSYPVRIIFQRQPLYQKVWLGSGQFICH